GTMWGRQGGRLCRSSVPDETMDQGELQQPSTSRMATRPVRAAKLDRTDGSLGKLMQVEERKPREKKTREKKIRPTSSEVKNEDLRESSSIQPIGDNGPASAAPFMESELDDAMAELTVNTSPNRPEGRKSYFGAKDSDSSTVLSLKDFELLSTLGTGAYAKVFKVEHKKTKGIYALKVVLKAMFIKTGSVEDEIAASVHIEKEILLACARLTIPRRRHCVLPD
ncbi:hypothetical protein PFISCL1PPCAC_28435, partial [Pristionchus fissidentatus]